MPEVELAAALALYGLKQPDGKAFLLDVLEGKQKTTSSFMSSEKRSLVRMTHTPTTTFLGIVANQFALPGLGSGMESAVGLSADPASMASSSVIFSLAKDKNDPTVWAALVAAMGDKEWATRAAAVHVVAMHNDPALIDKFAPLMDDKKEQVSFRAAAGYLRLYIIAHKSQVVTVQNNYATVAHTSSSVCHVLRLPSRISICFAAGNQLHTVTSASSLSAAPLLAFYMQSN